MPKFIDVTFTKEGFEKLKREHDELVIRRPQVLARLVAAREQGDLSENAGYHASKDELAQIDRRVRELKLLIKYGQVVDLKSSGQVTLGSTVKVKSDGDVFEYQIVGRLEADPIAAKLSEVSPIGSALLNSKVGDKVEVEAPSGKIVFEVIEIN